MCIHKETLTELDIHHRILRFENYFIAMSTRGVIKFEFELPILGSTVLLSRGLKMAINFILFWKPFGCFKDNWHLKDEYKNPDKRSELAYALSAKIITVSVITLFLSPFYFVYLFLHALYNYGDALKIAFECLSARVWTQYAKVQFRHYNELDHQLHARLCRAYKTSKLYLESFPSQLLHVTMKPIHLVSAGTFLIISVIGIVEPNFYEIAYVLMIITALGIVTAIARSFIIDDNFARRPQTCMKRIFTELHYLPHDWIEKAHTSKVRNEFTNVSQYVYAFVIHEWASCIIIPFYLGLYLRYRTTEIVDFFRNFTVSNDGVGDICSFSMMNIKKHGNPNWHANMYDVLKDIPEYSKPDHISKTDNGRTERSLVHFTITNPRWQPPESSVDYLKALQKRIENEKIALTSELDILPEENCLETSLSSLASCSPGIRVDTRFQRYNWQPQSAVPSSNRETHIEHSQHPISDHQMFSQFSSPNSRISCDFGSVCGSTYDPVMAMSMMNPHEDSMDPAEAMVDQNMRMSMLYLNNLHASNKLKRTYTDAPGSSNLDSYQSDSLLPPISRPQLRSNLFSSSSRYNEQQTSSVAFRRTNEDTPLLGD